MTNCYAQRIKMDASHSSDSARTEGGYAYTEFWRRLIAAIIDALTLYMPFAFVVFIVILLIGLVSAKNRLDPANIVLATLPILIIGGTWL